MKNKFDCVDISGCVYHSSTPSNELCYMKGNKCEDNVECYYKQLQRKEQECEQLKFINKNLNSALGYKRAGKTSYIQLAAEFDRYKQALEKIEEIALEQKARIEFLSNGYDNDPIMIDIISIINEVKMIKDIKNCREIHLGHGTVGVALDTTGTVEVLYNKPVTPVGSQSNELAGKSTIELNEKNVCLFFDGKDKIEAIDMLISDLSKIRQNLNEVKNADK